MERRGFAELLPSTAQFRGMEEMFQGSLGGNESGYCHAGPKPPKAAGVPTALYPIDPRSLDRVFAVGDNSAWTGEGHRAEFNQGLPRMAPRTNFQGRSGMVLVPAFERVAEGELAEAGFHAYADPVGGLRSRGRVADGSSAIAMPMSERSGLNADAGRNYDRVNVEGGRGMQGAWPVEDNESLSNEGSLSYDSLLAELEHLSLSSDHHLDQAMAKELSSDNHADHTAMKVKFMCSFGGKIFPRPSDGKLRYVGGETRIITVNKSIGYGELMQKLTGAYGQALLLKYQLPNEDLDALISVSSDEDFMNMMEEYDRLGGSEGSSRLRVFLFSAADHDFAHFDAMDGGRNPQQRYLDAINGIPETGFRRLPDSMQSVSLQQSEKWNGAARAQSIPSSLPSAQIPQGVANAVHLLVNMPLPSKEAITSTSVALASSSPPLSSLPTHTKQSGVADIPVPFIPERHLKVGNHSYSMLRPPEGHHLQAFGGSAVSQCTLRCRLPEPRTVDMPTKAPTIFSPPASHSDLIYHSDPQVDDPKLARIESHGKLSNLQEGIEVALPTLDRGEDVQLFPVDPQHIARQLPQSSFHQPLWQHPLDAQQDSYIRGDYRQQARFDGGLMQQSFSHHSLLSAHVNGDHLPTNEAVTFQPVDQAPQNQDDAFEGPPFQKVVSIHRLGHVVPAAAALQLVGSDPPSPRLAGRQVAGVQQNIQVQRPPNTPNQQKYGAVIDHYNDQASRAFCPSTLPMGYCELTAEQFAHQHTLPGELHSHYEDPFGHQQAMPHEQVSYSNEHAIPQQALSHVYSDTLIPPGIKLVHSIYEGTASSGVRHSDVSVRSVPLYAGPSMVQEKFMSHQDSQELEAERDVSAHQGKERQPILSGQQCYTVMPGGSEHLVQPIPKMLRSSQAGPGGSYAGMGVSEDLNPFLGPQLDESYQAYQKTEKFEPFGGTSFQLKQSPITGPHGDMDVLTEALRASELTQQMKDAQVPSSVPSAHEVRTAHPLTENVNSYPVLIIHSESPTISQMPVEKQEGDVLIQVPPAGAESFIQQTWWGDHLDTDLAKGEGSIYAFEQRQNIGEDEPKDASPFCKMLRPVGSHDTNALGENVNNIPSLSQNHSMEHVGKRLMDNDNPHSANMQRDTSLDELKKTSPNSEAVALPHGISDSDMLRALSSDKSASTTLPSCKVDESSVCMQLPAADCASLSSNNPVSLGILIKGEGPACTHVTMQDNSDEYIKGELQNLAEGVAEAVLRPTLPTGPTLSVHEWVQVSEDVNVEERMPQVNEGAEEENVTIEDSVFEEVKNEDSDNDDHVSDAVIAEAEAEAIVRGLQTIKNADLEELRELGSGTFGTVYYGKWRGSDVAIKRIKNSCFSGRPSHQDRLRADFWSEACMLAQLHHPNVVAFYGVVPDGPGGTLGTVTEYMVNGSLKQVLQSKDRTIDRSKRLQIAMDAAFGMEYLHSKNIVHFDLKCENLLVNMRDPQRPICKVADFGLSKIKHQTLVSGGVRGTLPWMAPELLNGSSSMVSEKVDVYSFGIVMWELLTGEEPYANMHYGAIIGGIVNNTLRPPVPHWCDPAWRSLMEWCWSADPVARPPFTEIANELRAMQASLHPRGQGHQAPIQAHVQKQS